MNAGDAGTAAEGEQQSECFCAREGFSEAQQRHEHNKDRGGVEQQRCYRQTCLLHSVEVAVVEEHQAADTGADEKPEITQSDAQGSTP